MLTKFAPIARAVNAAARLQHVRCMGHAPAHWKTDTEVALDQKSHMDCMPAPEGSWQEYQNQRSSKWNIQLGLSIGFLLVTIVAMNQTDCLYLHDLPNQKK